MDHIANSPAFLFLFLSLLTFSQVISGTTFTIINKCDYTIWPALLSSSSTTTTPLQTTGFQLPSAASTSLPIPPGWSGRLWARTLCSSDPNTSLFTCATADCASGNLQCGGSGPIPPATLAEFTIGPDPGPASSPDFYDVSLVDGFNLPISVDPVNGSGPCESTGCAADLGRQCPTELRAGGGACRSACEAFGTDEYCCRGAYASPDTCQASVYSEMFKALCPRSYSYAFDDPTSTFTCSGADYIITFCPATTSLKSSREMAPPVAPTQEEAGAGGSGNGPTVVNGGASDGSWLSNILFSGGGYSIRSLSGFAWKLTLFASVTTFLTLCLIFS